MGNSESYISTSESTSSRGSTTSTFEIMRQMSYESDVFYPDMTSRSHENFHPPGMSFEKPRLPDLTPQNFPAWRTNDINPVLLKYMKRSYQPCPETFKASAKKLAELSAAQKIPKFVTSFSGTHSQCIKLHWACLAGWCMCRYQYQPMTPLHLMPHTRLTSSNIIRKKSLPSSSQDDVSISSSVMSSNDVTLEEASDKNEPYDETMESVDDVENYDVTKEEVINLIGKETTV